MGLGKIHWEMAARFRSVRSCTVLGGSLMILRPVPNPDRSVKVCASEKERLDLLRSLHHQLILADDPSLTVCPPDNVTLRFAMPVTRGAQVARHLPMMGLRGADFIAEAVEEYLQTLH